MAEPGHPSAPHLPHAAPIDAYGNGGFRFGGMSHQGSLLCLPDGLWAWPVARFEDVTAAQFESVFVLKGAIDIFLIGCGADPQHLPDSVRARFREAGISANATSTGAAIRTYNILLAERRRVGAALIAV